MKMKNQNLAFQSEHGSFVYRGAAIIINNQKLLVAKHRDYPCYYTIGGKVEFNETSEEAVVRECFEETGIVFEADRLLFVQERFFELDEKKYHELVFFYLMRNPAQLNIADSIADNSFSDQGSLETLHWLPLGSLDKYNLVPEFLKVKSFDFASASYIEHIVSKE